MNGFRREFPIVLPAVNDCGFLSGGEMRIETYRQLYEFIDANKDVALYHFQVLHGEIRPKQADEYDPLAEC